MGFGINGGEGDDARISIFLMPDAPVGTNHRTITGCAVSLLGPGIEEAHQVTSEPSNEPWQGHRHHRQAAFLGAARRKASMLGQQRSQWRHDRVVLLQKGQQGPGGIQATNNHNRHGFDESVDPNKSVAVPVCVGKAGEERARHQPTAPS